MLDRDAGWLQWHLTGLLSRDTGTARLVRAARKPPPKPTTTGG